MNNVSGKAYDKATHEMLEKSSTLGIETARDRVKKQKKQCGYGNKGACCRACLMGPCRLNPNDPEAKGICGISLDGVVARNYARSVSVGTSTHAEHAIHLFEVLSKLKENKINAFKLKSFSKLVEIANQSNNDLKIISDADLIEIAVEEVGASFSGINKESKWFENLLCPKRFKRLNELDVIPKSIDSSVRELLHRTHMGSDGEGLNILKGAIKCSLSDLWGMDIASNLADTIMGSPKLVRSYANLGVLDKDSVNIAVHGNHPLIIESILRVKNEFDSVAEGAGAKNGINIVGVCCTGNEVTTRYGVPLAANMASQELAIVTGAIDGMVVDSQCIMPSLSNICECFHTELITTMSISKLPGATHVDFTIDNALETARKIIKICIDAFSKRDDKKIDIPPYKEETLVGFTMEGVLELLGNINPSDPLDVLIKKISSDSIKGIVLLGGCNNLRINPDYSCISITKKLLENNVLVIATGCVAGGLGKAGLLSPKATMKYAGSELKNFLIELGIAGGFKEGLPPVWHMGSCVDNSRVLRIVLALAKKLDLDVDELPVVVSAPEPMSEKLIAISTGVLALGLTIHWGMEPQVAGSKEVENYLKNPEKNKLDSKLFVEKDPDIAADKILSILNDKKTTLLEKL